MPRDYKLYLEDIFEAIQRIDSYVGGLGYEAFTNDNMRVDAVLRNMEVIGEATKRIPEDWKASQPQIEWQNIVGLRNIVIHVYFSVNRDIIWNTIKNDLPVLRVAIEAMLQDEGLTGGSG